MNPLRPRDVILLALTYAVGGFLILALVGGLRGGPLPPQAPVVALPAQAPAPVSQKAKTTAGDCDCPGCCCPGREFGTCECTRQRKHRPCSPACTCGCNDGLSCTCGDARGGAGSAGAAYAPALRLRASPGTPAPAACVRPAPVIIRAPVHAASAFAAPAYAPVPAYAPNYGPGPAHYAPQLRTPAGRSGGC